MWDDGDVGEDKYDIFGVISRIFHFTSPIIFPGKIKLHGVWKMKINLENVSFFRRWVQQQSKKLLYLSPNLLALLFWRRSQKEKYRTRFLFVFHDCQFERENFWCKGKLAFNWAQHNKCSNEAKERRENEQHIKERRIRVYEKEEFNFMPFCDVAKLCNVAWFLPTYRIRVAVMLKISSSA